MKWIRSHPKESWVIFMTLLLPLFLFLYVATTLVGHSIDSRAEIAKITPRISRLMGLIDAESEMRQSLSLVTDGNKLLTYPSTEEESVISTSLQAELRKIMSDAGLTVTNSQVLKIRKKENFDLIGLNVTATGTIEALDTALTGVEVYRPLVLVESLNVYPNRRRSNAQTNYRQTVTARFQLASLRVAR